MAGQPYTPGPGNLLTGQDLRTTPTTMTGKLTLTGGLASGGNVPTVTALALNGGTGSAISSQLGYDMAGSFVLTGGTSMAAGTIATVTFGSPLAAAPSAVLVSSANTKAAAAAGISAGAVAVTANGFSVFAATAGTIGGTYLISYMVVRSPFG